MKGQHLSGGKYWTASNEMFYVDQLASGECFKGCPYQSTLTPQQRLRLYITHAENRQKHGTYVPNGKHVIAYAKKLLAEI